MIIVSEISNLPENNTSNLKTTVYKKSVLKCSIYINIITGFKQCAQCCFLTVVLVMLCTKSTQFKNA